MNNKTPTSYYWITPTAKVITIPYIEEHHNYIWKHKEQFHEINFKEYGNLNPGSILTDRAVDCGYIRLGIDNRTRGAYIQYDKLKTPKKSLKVAINLIINSDAKGVGIKNNTTDERISIEEFWKHYAGLIENKQLENKNMKLTEAQIIRKVVKNEIKKVLSEVVDLSEKKSFTKYIIDHNQELSGFAIKKSKNDLINYVENARALAAEGKYAISDAYLDGVIDTIRTSSFKIGFMSLYNRYLAGTGNSIISL